MYTTISFIAAIIPSIILVCYYYRLDKQKPEPKGLVIKMFFLGILCVIPAIFLELLAIKFNQLFLWSPILFNLVRAFVVAGFCEEFIKLATVKKYAYNNVHFDEVADGILYTVVVSLGFACFENVMYVMSTGMETAIARAVLSVPMHAGCSGLMGYYIGKAKFAQSKKEEKKLMYKGLGIAILIHGLYNFCIFISYLFELGISKSTLILLFFSPLIPFIVLIISSM